MYFKERLDELSDKIAGECLDDYDTSEMIKNIGNLVCGLRSLGFTSVTEDAYAAAIFSLLKVCPWPLLSGHLVFIISLRLFSLHYCLFYPLQAKVENLAGDDYRFPVLESIKEWIQVSPCFHITD